MIFKVFVKDPKNVVIFFPEFGSYRADFKRKVVEFTRGEIMVFSPDIEMQVEFDEKDLEPKPGDDPGVLHYFDSIDIHEYNYKVNIEYLDTTNGEIPLHDHPAGTEELYVAAEEPYKGEICLEGEAHKPWANKTVAVKIIMK